MTEETCNVCLRKWKTLGWSEPARHRLRDIIILAICGVLCGAEGWVEIEEFGNAKKAFFTDLLDLPNGIPSHDTFGRVFALIDPKQFAREFHPMGAGDQPKGPRSDRD